jgi:molybdate/tungstate transport system substrate-binding protein
MSVKSEEKHEKKVVSRKLAITLGVLCVIILVGSAVAIDRQASQINSLNSQITSLQKSLSTQSENATNLLNSLITSASTSPPFAIGAAGTLKYAFGSVLTNFENLYPEITVAPPLFEGSGAVAVTENTTKQFSLEAAADTTTMPKYLFTQLADYEIAFGQTQMVIITNLASPAGLQLYNMWKGVQGIPVMSTSWNQTWQQMFNLIAINSSTKVGVSDPFTDPSGYQGAGMIRLAGLTFFGNISYLYNAIYNNPSKYYKASTETNLITLMQTQHIDFITSAYLSNAIPQTGNSTQTNLAYITLPDTINLRVLSNINYYHKANFSYTELGTTESFIINPVTYTVTIPKVSTNAAAATLFIKTLFSPSSQNIMMQNGITPLTPAIVYGNTASVPSIISSYVTPVNSTYSSLFPGS